MSERKQPIKITRKNECEEENAFYAPKKLFLFGLIALVGAFLISRTYNAIQRAGLLGFTSPNIIGGFHFHHWAYSLIALSILMPMAMFYMHRNKKIFGIIFILIAFFIGLFIDGIVYSDSPIFWE